MTRFNLRNALAALALGALALPALAADLPSRNTEAPAPVALPSFVTYDPFQIRLRVVDVAPTASNNAVYTVEAICCFSSHSIKAVNGLAGLGTVGSTWVFPPTVLLQYHFTNFGAFQPYLGVGVNYTHYFNAKSSGGLAGGPLWINDSFGVAVQAGFDYMITRNWGFNADVKYVTMSPSAKYPVALGGLKSTVAINPVIFGVGITYRFGGAASSVVAKY